jgi:hypothetical protein
MARIVTYEGKPLVRDGAIVVWDGEGPPPPECCCEAGPCCGLSPATETLQVSITEKTGDCEDMPDSLEMTYDEGGEIAGRYYWLSPDNIMACFVGCYLYLECNPDTGELKMAIVASCSHTFEVVSISCNPLELVFDMNYNEFCIGTCRITITL